MAVSKEERPEFQRGIRDARTQLPLLQNRWPKGFPVDPKRVRPLVIGVAPVVAEAMGWSVVYAHGVLMVWKLRPAYCDAVIHQARRFDLGGAASEAA